MKRLLLIVLAIVPALVFAMPRPKIVKSVCDRVEPEFWWAEMNNSTLQIMLHGENIGRYMPSINPKYNVKISSVERTDNPNYLFLYVDIRDAKPGVFQIDLRYTSRVYHINYELKQRKTGSRDRKGFDETDVFYLIMPDRFANGNPDNDSIGGLLKV